MKRRIANAVGGVFMFIGIVFLVLADRCNGTKWKP